MEDSQSRPLRAALQEVQQLRQMCLSLTNMDSSRLPGDLVQLLKDSGLWSDLQAFAVQFLGYSTAEKIEADQRRITFQEQSFWYVGRELHWLLMVSRCLGLIRFETLQKLRHSKIRVLGASVAASSIDLLVSLGAEDVAWIDDGVLDPSNLARLPMAKVADFGRPKSEVLKEFLLQRSPYGNYQAITGHVIISESERRQSTDVLAADFLRDADVILEVVDDLRIKAFIQTRYLSTRPQTLLLFIADLGTQPIVKTVVADKNGKVPYPFGRAWTNDEKAVIEQLASEREVKKKTLQQAAYLMVKESLPAEHTLQLMANVAGLMPFWSQTPVASRSSAALAALAVLESCGGVVDPEVTQRSPEIHQACQKLLGLLNA